MTTWILMGLQIRVAYRAFEATFKPSHDQIDRKSNTIMLPDEGSGGVILYSDLIVPSWYSVRRWGLGP
jgi:hypothetical protein